MEHLSERKIGTPVVKAAKSFREIVENFTDPRELLREAISNAIDWQASNIFIKVYEDANRADKELVIRIRDNGLGLSKERFTAFWNLADSSGLIRDELGKKLAGRVGEKGHGTKTYWKCRLLEVESVARESDGTLRHVIGEMKEPINTLLEGKVPDYEYAEGVEPHGETYTEVTVKGYHVRSTEDFRHETLKDYIQWFTKFGSIETQFSVDSNKEKALHLQGLGSTQLEMIPFGHVFPPVSNNIRSLQRTYNDTWPRYYVNRWGPKSLPVEGYPGSSVDIVFYLEGDSAKREYNSMLTRPGRTPQTWHYTVSDRYGFYVCKDWIPLPPSQRVNQWVAEKSEWTLYHAFINCQDFQLTANRASVGNTDRVFMAKVQETAEKFFDKEVRASPEYKVYRDEIEFTKERSVAERTEQDEKADLDYRYDHAKNKRSALYQPTECPPITFLEPRQEAEVLILFSTISAVKPDLFEFRIADYSTSRGIDALCVLETGQGGLQKGNLRYVEFKKALTHDFRDHTFARLAGIVCWECNLGNGAKVHDLAGQERTLHIGKDSGGNTTYMLLAPPELPTNNIRVYVLKDYLRERLGVSFTPQTR